MKINLECGSSLRNGYFNINNGPINLPKDLPDDIVFGVGSPVDLDSIIKEPIEEIIFNPPLNVIGPLDLVKVLSYWYEKLNLEGILKINFIDFRRVARLSYMEELEINQVHQLTFGPKNEFKSLVDTLTLVAVIKDIGFSIDILSSKDFIVTAELKKNAND